MVTVNISAMLAIDCHCEASARITSSTCRGAPAGRATSVPASFAIGRASREAHFKATVQPPYPGVSL